MLEKQNNRCTAFKWNTLLSNRVCVFLSSRLLFLCVCVCVPGGEIQTSSGTLDEGLDEDGDWEEEREIERVACEGDDFIPPKIMVRI